MKDSFVFRKEWYLALRDYDQDTKMEVFDAILMKVFEGENIEVSPLANMALKFIMPRIEQDIIRYNNVCEQRKVSGSKGGIAKATKYQQMVAKGSKNKQKVASVADNDNEYDNDISIQDTNVSMSIEEESTNVDKKKEAYYSPLAEMFDRFRKRYKQYGGKVRGLETELETLKKKHKDWKKIIPLLYEAIEKENAARQQARSMGRFFPEIKKLQTYINNRSWEEYTDECEYDDTDEYHPILDGIFTTWDDEEKCVRLSNNNIDGFCDGYSEENRPDGATVKYGMYTWKWSSGKVKWVRQ